MRFNIGPRPVGEPSASTDSQLPPDHPPIPSSSRRPPAQCPMHMSDSSAAKVGPAKCPVQHGKGKSDALNPLNSIPVGLSATDRAPGQKMLLPTDRTSSSIPRPKEASFEGYGEGPVWDYPSPQQFYNALVRKGWETPEDSVEMMVEIHNFLNERAWDEVMRWEKRLPGGDQAQLARFQGRPGEISPKARMHLWLGQVFPSKFNTTPPFDRHDWIVTRPANPSAPVPSPAGEKSDQNSGQTITTRYVIDYYSAPPDEDGNPVFSLDVRPALDSFESVSQRIKVSVEEWLGTQRPQ